MILEAKPMGTPQATSSSLVIPASGKIKNAHKRNPCARARAPLTLAPTTGAHEWRFKSTPMALYRRIVGASGELNALCFRFFSLKFGGRECLCVCCIASKRWLPPFLSTFTSFSCMPGACGQCGRCSLLQHRWPGPR